MAKPETVSEVLNAAADLLMRTGWCRKNYARDKHGRSCHQTDPDAVRFCAIGAIGHVADAHAGYHAELALVRYVGAGVAFWNDDCRRRAEVVTAMREVAKAEGTHQ